MSKFDRLNIDGKSKEELKRLGTFYKGEAEKCRKCKAFLASCITIASYLETILILIIHKCQEDVITQKPKLIFETMLTRRVKERNPDFLISISS